MRLTTGGVGLLLVVNMAIMAVMAWPLVKYRLSLNTTPPASLAETTAVDTAAAAAVPDTVTPTSSATHRPERPTATLTASPQSTPAAPYPLGQASGTQANQGLVLLSLSDGANDHLFAYQPLAMPLTRLTTGPWDDISPAISPDGTQVAFASNRNGYWDLYLLELNSGMVTRLTDTLEYDGAPSWSPDGQWIVYETYRGEQDGGLELYILPTTLDQPPIRLTEDPSADYSPAWSPLGRQVAFVSNRSGEPEIWLADLDLGEGDRFTNLSRSAQSVESHPGWSLDGSQLAWSAVENGYHNLYIWDRPPQEDGTPLTNPPRARYIGSGDWPAWSPDGAVILTLLSEPGRSYLSANFPGVPGVVIPPLALPGVLSGLSWGVPAIPFEKVAATLAKTYALTAQITPEPLWYPVLTPAAGLPSGRYKVVELEDTTAPQPYLHDMVDESFQVLRTQLAQQIGWDFLATLENAYVPLTQALSPGMRNDWLYTGRAFAFNHLPINAGWMVVVREDFAPDTYWRVYLRVRFQDGSVGRPLHAQPWDFNTRYSGNAATYEQGGELAPAAPPGYWFDFTSFAARYGWERLPALPLWRTSFTAAQFNEFAHTGGLDWRSAMLELYPSQALVTPTIVVPPTRTTSPTPSWYRTPTSTVTPTPRPTLTPVSPTPTATSTATLTPTPSPTSTIKPSNTPRIIPGETDNP